MSWSEPRPRPDWAAAGAGADEVVGDSWTITGQASGDGDDNVSGGSGDDELFGDSVASGSGTASGGGRDMLDGGIGTINSTGAQSATAAFRAAAPTT